MQKKNSFVFTRVTPDERSRIDGICEARGEDLSDFVRRSIRRELARLGYLNEAEKKALGMGGGS